MHSRFISKKYCNTECAYIDFSDLRVEMTLEKATR